MNDEKEGSSNGFAAAPTPLHRTMETPVIPTIGRDLFVISVCLIINNWALGMTCISSVRGRNLTKLPTYFLHITR